LNEYNTVLFGRRVAVRNTTHASPGGEAGQGGLPEDEVQLVVGLEPRGPAQDPVHVRLRHVLGEVLHGRAQGRVDCLRETALSHPASARIGVGSQSGA